MDAPSERTTRTTIPIDAIEMVLCDREFDAMAVYQTLSNLGANYLIPKRKPGARVGRTPAEEALD